MTVNRQTLELDLLTKKLLQKLAKQDDRSETKTIVRLIRGEALHRKIATPKQLGIDL
jgi:hypothetical protein